MMFTTFQEFKDFATNLGYSLHTIVKCHFYDKHGWGNIIFMTDTFGGTYCSFYFNPDTQELCDWKGESNEKHFTSIEELISYIKERKEHMEHKRNLDEINRLINEEY